MREPSYPPATADRRRLARWLVLAALLCAILAGKFQLIDRYGSDLPYWDQWDAEGDNLLRPYNEGRLHLAHLFAAHAEHRIFFTRVEVLSLFLANSHQWDARLEMVVNAGLHTVFALLLAALAVRLLPLPAAAAYAGVLAYLCTAPAAWENILGGFQSQFYFLLLLTSAHLAGTLLARPTWRNRLLATLAGAAALVCMGSGLMSALAIIVVLALEWLRKRRLSRLQIAMIALNLALCVVAVLIRSDSTANNWARAASFPAWAAAVWHEFKWPVNQPWMVLLNLGPALLLGAAWWRGRVRSPAAPLLLAGWLWYLFQSIALAYARGVVEHASFSYRYTDLRAIGFLTDALALGVLAAEAGSARVRRAWLAGAGLVAVVALAGLLQQSQKGKVDFLSRFPVINEARIESVRQYVTHHDAAFFEREPWTQLPYPNVQRLAMLLDLPSLRVTLPTSVRPPIPWEIEPVPAGANASIDYPAEGPAGAVPLGLEARYFKEGEGIASRVQLITEPFATDQRLVSLYVAGDPASGLKLALLGAAGDRHWSSDHLDMQPARWTRVNFYVTPGLYRLEAVAQADGWAALSQPFTETFLSHGAEIAVRSGPRLGATLAAVLGLAALAVMASSRDAGRWPQPAPDL